MQRLAGRLGIEVPAHERRMAGLAPPDLVARAASLKSATGPGRAMDRLAA
jgi:hypothetical protein